MSAWYYLLSVFVCVYLYHACEAIEPKTLWDNVSKLLGSIKKRHELARVPLEMCIYEFLDTRMYILTSNECIHISQIPICINIYIYLI